jgi:hypothetical protein
MRFPWISRSLHEEMMGLVRQQLEQVELERRVLLDRLGTLGLGGPLFSLAGSEVSSVSEEAEELVDPEAEEIEQLMKSRRRPSKLADALTRKAYRDFSRGQSGPSVKWLPKADAVNAALDEAEALGKQESTNLGRG